MFGAFANSWKTEDWSIRVIRGLFNMSALNALPFSVFSTTNLQLMKRTSSRTSGPPW